MPVAIAERERIDETQDELDALRELGVTRPGPRCTGPDLRNASGVLVLSTDKPFAVVHGGGRIYFVTEVNGKIRSIGGSHRDGTRPVSERTYYNIHKHVGLLATLTREVAECALAAKTVAERLRIVAASQLRAGSNAEEILSSRWGLSPQLGYYTSERVPGSLAHDELGLLWVTWPDGTSRCHDGKGDPPKAWTKTDGRLRWRVVEIKMGLTDDECDSAAVDAHASHPIRILQHVPMPEQVPTMSDQGVKCLSGITPSQHAAVSAARGRRARILAATAVTVTSAAEHFAAAVCALAQDADALSVTMVMSWTRREVHAGTAMGDARLAWLPFGYSHAAWGALQVEMTSPEQKCVIRTLQRLTAHARSIERVVTCGGSEYLARMWLGDASPPGHGRFYDLQRDMYTSVNGLVYSSARCTDIFRRPAPSVTSRTGGSANLWSTPESNASMLRHGYDSADVARHAGNRTWHASSPTVVGAINVPEWIVSDEAQVNRLRAAWQVRATTECRKLQVAAWIPPYMPEVIEVIS